MNDRTHVMIHTNEIITDKIESILSLLKTKNIIVIKTLIDTQYITRDTMMIALDLYLNSDREEYIRIFVNEIVNIVVEVFGGFDCEIDKVIINNLMFFLLMDDTLYYGESECNNCLIRLIDAGAIIDHSRIVMLPSFAFWHYISKNKILLTLQLILRVISRKHNLEIENYIFEYWYSQDLLKDCESLSTITSWALPIYITPIMQIIYDHTDYNKIVVGALIKSGYVDFHNNLIEHITDHEYIDILPLLSSLIVDSRNFDDVKLNDRAREIYDKLIQLFRSDEIAPVYDEIIKNLYEFNLFVN